MKSPFPRIPFLVINQHGKTGTVHAMSIAHNDILKKNVWCFRITTLDNYLELWDADDCIEVQLTPVLEPATIEVKHDLEL